MTLTIRGPLLAVGLGGAGARMASDAAKALGCKLLLASHDASDLGCGSGSEEAVAIHADTGPVINPTVGLVRSAAYDKIDRIRVQIYGHKTVLLVCNLAGKAGCAISPVISEACAAEDAQVISLAIMPFGYEKSKLFSAGVALRRLRESSECTIVLDNDSLLESNPDLTPKECYGIADAAAMHMVHAAREGADIAGYRDNILAASRADIKLDASLRDALKMLHGSAAHPESVMHSMVYVAGGENMPAGMLRAAARITEGVLAGGRKGGQNCEPQSLPGRLHGAEVASVPSSAATRQDAAAGGGSRVVIMSAVRGMAKFERYDPLGVIIPGDKELDWSDPECSIDCGDVLSSMRQLE